jgi:site-specific DNA recombinase
MRAGCYCRVSTDKDEQIQSLSKQIEFFTDFVVNKGHELFRIYADEGISGKQVKNRTQFIQMLKDAEQKKFDILFVKDISRFARNTEDFLHSIRKLKNLGINLFFITNNLNIQEGNEFFLTMLAAIAQEESAKLSEKIKFGKNITAKHGRVPNFVFGYDKIDKYTLVPNVTEAEIVKKIFNLYINEGFGTGRIAGYLNDNHYVTKKNKQKKWSQVVVTQILNNEIYIGKIINKKSEVVDFITGQRKDINRENQIIVERPELQIISEEDFHKVKTILNGKRDNFKLMNKRDSVKFTLSNLIKCSECGYSFRRCQRQYAENGKIYKWWTCSIRNARGTNACINDIKIDEEELEISIKLFLQQLLDRRGKTIKTIISKLNSLINQYNNSTTNSKKDIEKKLNEIVKQKEKYMDMYKNEIINIDELKEYTKDINEEMQKLKTTLSNAGNIDKITTDVEKEVNDYFDIVESIINSDIINNQKLKRIVDKILVSPDGTVKIYLKVDSTNNLSFDMPLQLEETVPYTNIGSYSNYKMEWYLKIAS